MIKDKSMGRKLIFLDIDGTLLPPGDMLIPESTLAALDRARANGHKLFLCTGRNHRMTEPLLRHDCFAGAVCSAGGYVLCDGKTLVDIPMEPQQAEGVRAALERNGVECTLEARDATFGGSKMAERWKFIHKKNDAPLNSEAERWILLTTRLPSNTTDGILAKSESKRTICAALDAASLPDAIAILQSASFNASTSLTPSPVMATTLPAFLSAKRSFFFCSGDTLPNTVYTGAAFSSSSSVFFRIVLMTWGYWR